MTVIFVETEADRAQRYRFFRNVVEVSGGEGGVHPR